MMKRSLCSLSSVSVAMTGESVVTLSGTLINISLSVETNGGPLNRKPKINISVSVAMTSSWHRAGGRFACLLRCVRFLTLRNALKDCSAFKPKIEGSTAARSLIYMSLLQQIIVLYHRRLQCQLQ
jgi:hypothetical protein